MSEEMYRRFESIHKNYDTMNHVLSLGLDMGWRKRAAKETILEKKDYKILDVASGTGDLAITMFRESRKNGKNVRITGFDVNKHMLSVAKEKVKRLGLDIDFKLGPAESLKFPSKSFEIVTSSFALRDFDSLQKFVEEAHRVLKRNGKIVLMDMARPEGTLSRYFFKAYSKIMLLEGMFIDSEAYSFLVRSINEFDKKKLLKMLKDQGFVDIKLDDLPSNVAFLVTARKPS